MDENAIDAISRHRSESPIEIRNGAHTSGQKLNTKFPASSLGACGKGRYDGAVGLQSTPIRITCGNGSSAQRADPFAVDEPDLSSFMPKPVQQKPTEVRETPR